MDYSYSEQPFPFILLASIFCEYQRSLILDRLSEMEWTRTHNALYRFSVPRTAHASQAISTVVRDAAKTTRLRSILINRLHKNLAESPIIDVHHYEANDSIGVHTDKDLPEVRAVINLNDQWSIDQQGIWILSRSTNLLEGTRFIPPLSNTGFAFGSGKHTYHALTERSFGSSYALVIRYKILT